MKYIKMIDLGRFSLDGMHVTDYPAGLILDNNTPGEVKAYFVKTKKATEIEPKTANKTIKPEEKKVVAPEVAKTKKSKKRK